MCAQAQLRVYLPIFRGSLLTHEGPCPYQQLLMRLRLKCRSSEHHSEVAGGQAEPSSVQSSWTAVYLRGPVAGIPDEHASRRERFAELDELQPGWQVELRSRGAGGTVDAVFFSPEGECSCMSCCKTPREHMYGCCFFHGLVSFAGNFVTP